MNDILLALFPLYGLAFLLGIKHSVDVDHLVAVSSLLTRSPNLKVTTSLSLAWALGHMVTATIITYLLFIFSDTLLRPLLDNFELIVAFMLIVIAVLTLAWEFDIIKRGKHSHGHQHQDGNIHYHSKDGTAHAHTQEPPTSQYEHSHLYFLSYRGEYATISVIGIIHGLASNDELLLLMTLTLGLTDYLLVFIGVLVFTIGVVLGMIGYALIIKYPLQSLGSENVTRYLNISFAILAFSYAIYLLTGGDTLNLLPSI